MDLALGARRLEVAALPHPDHVHTELSAQGGLAQRLADQRRSVRHGLCDQQAVEATDRVSHGVAADRPPREGLGHHLVEPHHVLAPCKREDVDRSLVARGRDDGDILRDRAHRGGHIGVREVVRRADDERRPLHPDAPPGFRVVEIAHDGVQAEIVQAQRLVDLRNQQRVGGVVLLEAANQRSGHGVVVREQRVTRDLGRQFARRARRGLRLHPRLVEELDEGEGQQHQQEDDPRKKHQDREDAPEVRMESDVAEAKRRHHGESPVEAGDPGVLLPLAQHQDVEDHGVDRDHAHQDEQEAQ